ncbi:MAG: HAMP domain-containing protein [Alphaproteobacteria bacterium]|nr:MAG: HAMP domain-containing protein [Alphaproteobacteria bacterium]
MAVLIGAALLIAQLINFTLILNERQKTSLAQSQGPAVARFVTVASDLVQAPPDFRFAVLEDAPRRGASFRIAPESNVAADEERDSSTEARLGQSLANAGLKVAEVRAASRSGSAWLNGRIATPRPDPWLSARLGLATLLLYLIVLGATLFVAARLARPLRDLAAAAERFGGREAPPTVASRGPSDLRRAIDAFNAMNGRVVALLDEKDRMLGAIGHDLRTPLASLRIRAESVEDEEERAAMAATIAEMASMLEDIVVLARSGRAREPERAMDVTALADALVEEQRALGRSVTLLPSDPQPAKVQPTLLRRAIRNLIDNAVKYAGSATVEVRRETGRVVIAVADTGPGLPPDQLERVTEPFYRVEQSRNRDTGGSGLGLAIARAAAESHAGELRLMNRPEGGLIATLSLPSDA